MDFDQYVAARRGRLIEHAVLLGCADGEAGTYVDQVLLEQRKRIRRAEDPDPLVREALERAIAGPRERRSRTGAFVALGLVAVAVAIGVALTYRPPPDAMPSLFALNGDQAEQLLEDRGFHVVLRSAPTCEPPGLVVGSDPPSGGPVRKGATVTVRTSVISGSHCEPNYPARSAAWEFIQFAIGSGPAPEFTRTVTVVVDSQDPYSLDHVAAVDPDRWGGLFRRVARTARGTVPTDSGMPRLSVRSNVLPTVLCGVPKPSGTGDRRVLRLQIDTRPTGDLGGCPMTIDLYRGTDEAIDGVVVYTPKEPSAEDDTDTAATQ
jgi:PASTA domain